MIPQIIASKYLDMTMNRYKKIVRNLTESLWFEESYKRGIVAVNHFPYSETKQKKQSIFLGEFSLSGFQFSCKEYAVWFAIDLPDRTVKRPKEYFTAKHISDRNRLTYRVMEIVAEEQKNYLQSLNPVDLKNVSLEDILKMVKNSYSKGYCDKSIISRIKNKKKVKICRNNLSDLKTLFPSKAHCAGYKIQEIIQSTDGDLSDALIREELVNRYELSLQNRTVAVYRNSMGIPSSRNRKNCKPIPMGEYRALSEEGVKSVENKPGVYEFSLLSTEITYNQGSSNIVYFGSTKTLKKRLSSYIKGYGHTVDICQFIKSNVMNFRYIICNEHQALESKMIHDFERNYGQIPLLNKLKPKMV